MTNLKDILSKLNQNLNTLRERKAQYDAIYGDNTPPDLLDQITDHQQAIALTRQVITGEISETTWRDTLRPLLLTIRERSNEAAINISDIENSVLTIEGSVLNNAHAADDVTGRDKITQTAEGSHIAQASHSGHAEVNTSTFDQRGQQPETQYNAAHDINIYEQPAEAAPQRNKNLTILLNTVRKIWVEEYLNSTLLNAIYLDLELQQKPDAVPQPFEELNIRLQQPEQDLPTGTRAYHVYQQAQGSMLILGQPGAGKSTTLATLARDLLAEAKDDPSAPVPVIFNLSSWAAGQKPLTEWLEDELNQQYQVSRKLARRWLAEWQLALLLDGLDEVTQDKREACVQAINTYRANSMGPLVVCSRLHDYEALQVRLRLSQAIFLKKLTRPQVKNYFQRLQNQQTGNSANGGLLTLFERIWQDEALRELTETPLMLNIITVTYAHPQAPPLPQGQGDRLRAQIFDAYSERMFNRLGRKVSLLYNPEITLRCLRYLAAQLQAHSLTQFSIGQIRGSWLPTDQIRRRYRWLYGLSVGLVFGLIGGLSAGLIGGLIFGLIGGLIFGLGSENAPTESLHWAWRPALKPFRLALLGGLLGGGGVGLLAEVGIVLPTWLAWGLIFGLICGLIYGLSAGLVGGLIVGLVGGLVGRLIVGLIVGLLYGLIYGLSVGLVFGLVFGLLGGLSVESISYKVDPDQEVRRSWRSTLIGGLIVGLIVGLSGVLLGGLIGGLSVGLGNVLFFMLLVGLTYGGTFLIQHYLRLLLLNRHNLLPFKLIPFLNQATELIFLQRLGGSYRFIHRSLQEHFAARWLPQWLPEDATAYHNRGLTYRDLQQHEQALADFNRAIELNPKYATAYHNRGLTYRDLQQHEQALADYNRAIELNPEDANAYHNRGVTYHYLQQHEQALADYNRTIELNPEDTTAYHNRGITYHYLQQHEQALADYNRTIELNSEDATAYHNRGLTYSNLKQHERALTDFNRAIELNPEDATAYSNRGITYSYLKQHERALANFNRAIELNPEDATAYHNRGLTYNNLKQHEQALADYNRVIELKPEDALAFYNTACLYALQNNVAAALPPLRRALELDPGETLALIPADTDFDYIRVDTRFRTLLAEFAEPVD